MSNQQRFSGEWSDKPLSDLAVVTMGQSPSSTFYNSHGEGLPLIQGNADIEYRKTIERVWTSQGNKRCESGDLILTVRAPVGAVAVASKNAYIGRGVCGLKPIGDSSFLFHALVHAENQWLAFEQGSTFTAANAEQIGQFCLYVPDDENEQRAIAEVLSDVDGLINALDALIAKKRAIKQATMQQLLTGKTRLPGFSGAWETKRFEEVFKRLNGNFHKIPTSEYSVNGLYPVIDQGQETIIAYSDRTEKLFKCPADGVIVFGDHTRIVKYVDMDFLIGADGTQLITTRSDGITKFFFYQLSIKDIPNTGYNRHFKFLKDLTFEIPNIKEQRAIAAVFSDMDAEIVALEQRRDKTISIKQGMMQQLLTGKVRLLKAEH